MNEPLVRGPHGEELVQVMPQPCRPEDGVPGVYLEASAQRLTGDEPLRVADALRAAWSEANGGAAPPTGRKSRGYVVIGYDARYVVGTPGNRGLVANIGEVHLVRREARKSARKLRAHDQIDEVDTEYVVAELVTKDDGSTP